MLDSDIRRAVRRFVRREASLQPNVVIEEMPLPGGDARIDMAVVNGQLHGFEFKSDGDTLKRLPAQREAYSRVFDTVTLTVSARHERSALKQIPEWWGLQLAIQSGRTKARLEWLRQPGTNAGVDPFDILTLLDRSEVVTLLKKLAIVAPVRKLYLFELNATVVDHVPLVVLKDYVRTTIKERHRSVSQQR